MRGIRPSKQVSVGAPRKSSGSSSLFSHTTNPKVAPLKSRIYTKEILREDPSAFGNIGFGDTGLGSTPSLLGMSRKSK